MSAAIDTEERAAAWLLRREEAGWSEEDQAALDVWLEASSFNRVAFYRLEYGWRKADRLAALKSPVLPTPGSRFALLAFWRPAAIAVVLLAMVAGGIVAWPRLESERPTTNSYATMLGGRASFPLEDGSKVELNTDTRLRTSLTTTARTAWLDQGEAYFDVAADVERPFLIHAGTRLIAVLGTKFSVRRDGDRVIVAVLDGRVQVYAKPDSGIITAPGDIVTVQGDAAVVEHASVAGVASAMSWRQGLLTFEHASLSDAAAEFNRYNRKKLLVDATAAAAVHVGGTFDAENVDAFARLMRQAYGLKVEDDGATIRISGPRRQR